MDNTDEMAHARGRGGAQIIEDKEKCRALHSADGPLAQRENGCGYCHPGDGAWERGPKELSSFEAPTNNHGPLHENPLGPVSILG